MHTITKEFKFSAAHRLLGHPTCGRPHGHNYRVIVELSSNELNDGMVTDYGNLRAVRNYVDDHLDHRYLVSWELVQSRDPIMIACSEIAGWSVELPVERSTAECLAEYLYTRFKPLFPYLSAVTVCETDSTTATYRPDEFGSERMVFGLKEAVKA